MCRLLTLRSSCPTQDLKATLDPTVTEELTVNPDGLEADPPTPGPSNGQKEGSSEEELDTLCDGDMTGKQIKRTIGNGIMKLGLLFLENLKPSPDQPNVIFSPLSLSVALSQLALGMSGIYNGKIKNSENNRCYSDRNMLIQSICLSESQEQPMIQKSCFYITCMLMLCPAITLPSAASCATFAKGACPSPAASI